MCQSSQTSQLTPNAPSAKRVDAKSENSGIMQLPRIALRCRHCNLPLGYLVLTAQGYVIEIESRHHGEIHNNVIPLTLAPPDVPTVAPSKLTQ